MLFDVFLHCFRSNKPFNMHIIPRPHKSIVCVYLRSQFYRFTIDIFIKMLFHVWFISGLSMQDVELCSQWLINRIEQVNIRWKVFFFFSIRNKTKLNLKQNVATCQGNIITEPFSNNWIAEAQHLRHKIKPFYYYIYYYDDVISDKNQ